MSLGRTLVDHPQYGLCVCVGGGGGGGDHNTSLKRCHNEWLHVPLGASAMAALGNIVDQSGWSWNGESAGHAMVKWHFPV